MTQMQPVRQHLDALDPLSTSVAVVYLMHIKVMIKSAYVKLAGQDQRALTIEENVDKLVSSVKSELMDRLYALSATNTLLTSKLTALTVNVMIIMVENAVRTIQEFAIFVVRIAMVQNAHNVGLVVLMHHVMSPEFVLVRKDTSMMHSQDVHGTLANQLITESAIQLVTPVQDH
jgi:hypothetical protein